MNANKVAIFLIIALLFVVLVLEGLNKYKNGVIDTYEQFTSKQEEVIKESNSLITDLKVKVTYYGRFRPWIRGKRYRTTRIREGDRREKITIRVYTVNVDTYTTLNNVVNII